MREVDDIADELSARDEKVAGLDAWRDEIDRIYEDAPTSLIGRELALAVSRFSMRRDDFLAVIDGMAMDALEEIRAPSWEKFDLYCHRVASAVGLLSVRAFGAPEEAGRDLAINLGRALQITNILRDVDEDAERNRLYLPRELLEKHGVTADQTNGFDPAATLAHSGLDQACRDLAEAAGARFAQSEAAMRRCPSRTVKPARVMMEVYRRTYDALLKRGWASPRAPISIAKPLKLWIALRRGLL